MEEARRRVFSEFDINEHFTSQRSTPSHSHFDNEEHEPVPILPFRDNQTSHVEGRRLIPQRDIVDVVGLCERLTHNKASRALWEWKHLPPWTTSPIAWVGVAAGRIIGHVGAVPLRGQVDGEDTFFFLLGGTMIDPSFHGVELNRWFSVTNAADEIRRAHPNGILFGFTGQQSRLWATSTSQKSTSWIERADDRIVPLRREGRIEAETSRFDLRPWSWEAPEIDELWLRLRDTIRMGLIRDRTYLAWRYGKHPVFEYSLFGVYDGESPIGWLVTSKREMLGDWEAEVRIQDMLLPPESTWPVLRRAASVLRAKSLVLWLPAHLVPQGSVSRMTGWHATYHSLSPAVSNEDLKKNIYYTLGEADEWW